MLDNAGVTPSAARLAAFCEGWEQLCGPGPILTAAERHLVILAARRAWAGADSVAPDATLIEEAAHWLAADAGGITEELVANFEARGLDRWRYLETVGVVGRLSHIDFYARGLGASLPELGEPSTEPPTGNIVADATRTDGWVPATSELFAPHVLDAMPAEGDALRNLLEPSYVTVDEIFSDFGVLDHLDRDQIEYIAARTSYLNDCFY